MAPRFQFQGIWHRRRTSREDNGAHPSCPDITLWIQLAQNTLPCPDVDKLLLHCAQCDECLDVLRQSSPLLAARITRQEQDLTGQFNARAVWRHQLAVRLARTPCLARRRLSIDKAIWWAATFVSVALALAAVLLWSSYQHSPERLLAMAYAHDRFLEFRIPLAPYAPPVAEFSSRGDGAQHESSSLLSARATIQQHLEHSPSDPYWLALLARADLLEANYDGAIDILDRLIAAGKGKPSLLTDAASAYFQRGTATDSESDRATALDYLRRADEMAPDNPVILFNEALVMEDRAQLINAVETWNRYLRFERDPQWLAEGRKHLASLEVRLDQLRSHQSRMEQHLASPHALRALAADPATLAALDEELSTTLLSGLLNTAYPLPADRSRGSPCSSQCSAARSLLSALAASLQQHHHDAWLQQLLPATHQPASSGFVLAVHLLAEALHADDTGDYLKGMSTSQAARDTFLRIHNPAGTARSWLEYAYASQRLGKVHTCYLAARSLAELYPDFIWIRSNSLTEEGICDEGPGATTEIDPVYLRAAKLAQDHGFALLAMRVQNQISGSAIEAGDVETTWHICLATMHQFYAGDYPPFRAYTILAGLAEAEKSSPRTHLELLLQRELLSLLEMTPSRSLIPSQRYDLAIAAIRAGSIADAQHQLAEVRTELNQQTDVPSLRTFLADSEIALANLYITRGDLSAASKLLGSAKAHMAGLDDESEAAALAAAEGQLDLALGDPGKAEPSLRQAILHAESSGERHLVPDIPFARENRKLYATMAGIWLAQGKSGIAILALWERYRLRILGKPVPSCPDQRLDCLAPQLHQELAAVLGPHTKLIGQILLPDRILDYRSDGTQVEWRERPVQQRQIFTADAVLARLAESPATSMTSVGEAARRAGDLLVPDLRNPPARFTTLLIEGDPALGNLPWPAVESTTGPIGLTFSLQDVPSILLPHPFPHPDAGARPLIVGASVGAGISPLLPAALSEARAIAALDQQSSVLLATQATRSAVEQQIAHASVLHFAGHTAQYDGSTRLLLFPASAADHQPYLDSSAFRSHPPRDARLVVLSACSTGRESPSWDHDISDMVDTLAELGVPEIVATRWKIDSGSAAQIMQTLYENLAQGATVPQALTRARIALARDPRYRHPYYWAGYFASGTAPLDVQSIFRNEPQSSTGLHHDLR